MGHDEKKALYESIMKDIAKIVKRQINEKVDNVQRTEQMDNICKALKREGYIGTIENILRDTAGDYYFRFDIDEKALVVGQKMVDFAFKLNPEQKGKIVFYWIMLAAVFYDQLNIMIARGEYKVNVFGGLDNGTVDVVKKRAAALIEKVEENIEEDKSHLLKAEKLGEHMDKLVVLLKK